MVLFCVLLGRQGSRSCGYFNAKMRASRSTAKSDRSKAALVVVVGAAVASFGVYGAIGFRAVKSTTTRFVAVVESGK